MKRYASGFEARNVKRKKLSRKNDSRDDSHVRNIVSRFTDDEVSDMIETNHSEISRRHIDVTGHAIFRSVFDRFYIQAKLEISQPGDASEVQADELAASVMNGDAESSRATLSKQNPVVAPQAESAGMQTSGEFDSQLQTSKGSGQKLNEDVRSELETHTGTDLSQVNVHTDPQADQMSKSINAKAFTHGQDIYFGQGQYNASTDQGKELIAHEVAHTVQQSQGIQPKIQRFEAWEHAKMGDKGTGGDHTDNGKGRPVVLSPYITVSFGELTAMAGDYFGSEEEILELAKKPGSFEENGKVEPTDYAERKYFYSKPGTVDELRYIIYYHINARDADDDVRDMFSKKVRSAVDDRMLQLLPTNFDHFTNSREGDRYKSFSGKLNSDKYKDSLPNNEMAFRTYHERAIREAFAAGVNRAPLDYAFFLEGFASHFLTDAFASGHIRTQIISIIEWWEKIVPAFDMQLALWITRHIAPKGKGFVYDATLKSIQELTKGFSFGSLIAGILHDYDNEVGVRATVNGVPMTLYGDSQVMYQSTGQIANNPDKKATVDIAAKAVEVSVGDIETAYADGREGNMSLDQTIAALAPEGLFNVEKMWPVEMDNQSEPNPKELFTPDRTQLNWKVSSVSDLFGDPRMKKALTNYVNTRVVGNLTAAKKAMPLPEKAIAGKGLGKVISKLSGSALRIQNTLNEVINYSPDQDITGSLEKTNRSLFDLYEKTKKDGTLGTLTVMQRIQLLDEGLHGQQADARNTPTENRFLNYQMLVDVITTTPAQQIPVVLDWLQSDMTGLQRLYDYLPEEYRQPVIEYIKPAYVGKNSPLFNIPYETFLKQIEQNIKERGNTQFQSHYTNFCGKVAAVRLWIKLDPAGYTRFMTDLYYTGQAQINGRTFTTPPAVVNAINAKRVIPDPEQKVVFKNPESEERMPQMMNMVLFLTLSAEFAYLPGGYSAEKHKENKPWAGAAIRPESKLLEALGFDVEVVGFFGRGTSKKNYRKLEDAALSRKPVFLLVNSSRLDIHSKANDDYEKAPTDLSHPGIGTHWIAVRYVDPKEGKVAFWEYGKDRTIPYEALDEVLAGGIIINGYHGKKIVLSESGDEASFEN